MSKKSLLIFDLDGTLIDSVPDLANAVNATLADLGRDTFREDTIRHWVGNGASVLMARALSGNTQIDAALPAELTQQALALFFNHYPTHACQQTRAYEGVTKGLTQIKAAYTLAIVTNKPAEFVPDILTNLGWQGLFRKVLGGDSLPTKKPDPAPLLHVCQQLGFSTAQSYMIGDSKNDILAGKNAGIDTLAVSYGYNYGEDIRQSEPTHTFDDFGALTEFLSHARV